MIEAYIKVFVGLFLATYIYYIFCNVMYKHFAESMPWLVKIVIAPFLIFFDFPLNMMISPFLWDLPQEWLLTARMKRYKTYIESGYNNLSKGDQRRHRFAVFLCDHRVFGLDRWDKITGDHC
jgi:hypothetical protein